MVKASDVRKAAASGGAYSELLPDASGPPTSTYHNPRTGQEFHGLPVDPWSLELYMKKHRLLPGPAPAELQEQWEKTKLTLVDPANTTKNLNEAEKMLSEFEKNVAERVDQGLAALVERLSQQVADLQVRLDNPGAPVQPVPVEPRQLDMLLEA